MAFAALGKRERAWELPAMINPVNHGGNRGLQGGILRRRGRRLCARAAHRPRRIELVHRLGRLDVSAHRGVAAGPEARGGRLSLAPCLPADWQAFKIRYRYRETVYHIAVSQTRAGDAGTNGVTRVTVDGIERHDQAIPRRE